MFSFVSKHDVRALVGETLGERPRSITPMAYGLLNQNFLVDGAFVFKAYRREMTKAKVEEMHWLMTHVARHGLPVPLPIATYRMGEHVAALYPFVHGVHPPRYQGGVSAMRNMGDMLGQIDAVLKSFHPAGAKPPSSRMAKWDPEKALLEISEIRRSLRGKSVVVQSDVERSLAVHERIIEAGDWHKKRFFKLPVRVCHGDYHGKNFLMDGDAIVAVVDWEKSGWDWWSFEVMRSVIFNCRSSDSALNWNAVRVYLRGYRNHVALTHLEKELAYDAGYFKMIFSFWAIKQYVAGYRGARENVLRRAKLLPYLSKNRAEFSERIATLLG